jgi:hypothetical protein
MGGEREPRQTRPSFGAKFGEAGLFAAVVHVRAQQGVDPMFAYLALRAVGLDHIGVET